MRDAKIANASLRFPGAQSCELGVEIDKVVHLDEIEALRPQKRE